MDKNTYFIHNHSFPFSLLMNSRLSKYIILNLKSEKTINWVIIDPIACDRGEFVFIYAKKNSQTSTK